MAEKGFSTTFSNGFRLKKNWNDENLQYGDDSFWVHIILSPAADKGGLNVVIPF